MDYLIRILPKKFNFRAFGVFLPQTVEEARRRQSLSPVAVAALGRALAGVALLSADLKIGKILLQINGGGPLGEILAEADYQGNLRGLVKNPQVYLPPENKKLPVGKAVGKEGFINVIRDYGLKEIYQSSSDLISGEIAEDLAYYLTTSEQVPSACALGVLVDTDGSVITAGGFLIQKLPSAEDHEVSHLEKRLSEIKPVTDYLSSGIKIEELLHEIFGEIEILEKREVRFKCSCSMNRVEEALVALGKEELEDMLREGKPVEITCEFCKEKYIINIERLRKLLTEVERKKGSSD
ncbi:Hsp33 family molecular chaperone HslO [Caldimicrobium thiodismutans]|uniref:Hsp33 family molecular chaperone HslO n=1 Tax=Caldimicrobium thiodismutans TaxID=1653476 RepID=UPI0008394D97|nr:Hsp33 family molecular chaperone HslO [Caldimicrobium thiodismutans]